MYVESSNLNEVDLIQILSEYHYVTNIMLIHVENIILQT